MKKCYYLNNLSEIPTVAISLDKKHLLIGIDWFLAKNEGTQYNCSQDVFCVPQSYSKDLLFNKLCDLINAKMYGEYIVLEAKEKPVSFESLKGQVIQDIDISEDKTELYIETEGYFYTLYHEQDCCEDVYLESITEGYRDILLGNTILKAEETCNSPEHGPTYTFYKLATKNGYVDIRWHGESNGYYSESVDIDIKDKSLYYLEQYIKAKTKDEIEQIIKKLENNTNNT